jgi:hypothetical protein
VKRIEAIALLAGCVPLANRLGGRVSVGQLNLTDADQIAIAGFHKVMLYENGLWLAESEVCQEAGLKPRDIGALEFVWATLTVKRIRSQHESGEQLDG